MLQYITQLDAVAPKWKDGFIQSGAGGGRGAAVAGPGEEQERLLLPASSLGGGGDQVEPTIYRCPLRQHLGWGGRGQR